MGLDLLCIGIGFNTASGRCCCNLKVISMNQLWQVSIPQAVGTVATIKAAKELLQKQRVSIPQAVGTVATRNGWIL